MKRIAVVLGASAASAANAQLLATARQLAGSDARVTALAFEGDAGRIVYGAAEAVLLCAPWLAEAGPDGVVSALAEACGVLRPDVLVMAHDALGREAAPRLAARLGGQVVTDCTAAWRDAGTDAIVAERPCFSGKAVSTWAMGAGSLRILAMRRTSAAVELPAGSATARVLDLRIPAPPRMSLIERVVPPPGEVRLEDAEVVIGVGRGLGNAEAFRSSIVEGLAPALGAACGGSRGAVDLGIVPAELQIGLTGRVISPKVYVAIGLSGSPQHMAGCGGAGTIVAINTDPQAPIFAYAQYGVVGDYRRVVPAFAEQLRSIISRPA